LAVPQFFMEGHMKKHSQITVAIALALAVLLSACGSSANSTPASSPAATDTAVSIPTTVSSTITNTPDPCAPGNIEAEVQKVHKYMREFDDASSLAASRPREQLADAIAQLQSIRREAEDQVIPYCLGDLKTYQISHMNSVINTLIAFMGEDCRSGYRTGQAATRSILDGTRPRARNDRGSRHCRSAHHGNSKAQSLATKSIH
jgi:hypothetical protein